MGGLIIPAHAQRILRFTFLLIVLITPGTPGLAQDGDSAPPSAKEVWLADIDALDQFLRQYHPDPFFRTGEGTWREGLGAARDLVAMGGSDAAITTALMAAVARLKDGHTRLEPVDIDAFANWIPLRFYEFDDGVHVTVAAEQYADLIGYHLISVDGTPVRDVMAMVATATSGDNTFQVSEGAAALLSNAGLLAGLGVMTKPNGSITLGFEEHDGTQVTRTIATAKSWYSVNYRNWGELFGPPFEPFDVYKTPFQNGKSPLAYREPPNESDAPFMASRMPFWARSNLDETILTFQFNYFAEIGELSWDEFRGQMWGILDRTQPERFIIDLRYNFGGDGGMVRAFMNELMARPEYANGDRLVVLTGRQTFSAAVMLVAELKNHTDAVFVGEPAGAPLNHYGDPTSVTLPSGRLELVVSTLYWQLGYPSERSNLMPVNACAPIRASDYFSGVDVAWDIATQVEIAEIRPLALTCILGSD